MSFQWIAELLILTDVEYRDGNAVHDIWFKPYHFGLLTAKQWYKSLYLRWLFFAESMQTMAHAGLQSVPPGSTVQQVFDASAYLAVHLTSTSCIQDWKRWLNLRSGLLKSTLLDLLYPSTVLQLRRPDFATVQSRNSIWKALRICLCNFKSMACHILQTF